MKEEITRKKKKSSFVGLPRSDNIYILANKEPRHSRRCQSETKARTRARYLAVKCVCVLKKCDEEKKKEKLEKKPNEKMQFVV